MKNKPIILKSFLGTIKPKRNTTASENYWKLIGTRGRVIDYQVSSHRVLVLFDFSLDDYQLENHNPVKNSIWIELTDLQVENE